MDSDKNSMRRREQLVMFHDYILQEGSDFHVNLKIIAFTIMLLSLRE